MSDDPSEERHGSGGPPGDIEIPDDPKDPIDRPLTRWDHAHQMTIWDSSPVEPQYEAPEYYIKEGPTREAPNQKEFWRLVEYSCTSCRRTCLIDHAEEAAKYHECRDCARVPALDREVHDHRLTSLLWAHQAAADSTARAGEATSVLPAPSAPRRGSEEPAGSGGLPPDPEAGPHRGVGDPEEREQPQRRLSDRLASDGGHRE